MSARKLLNLIEHWTCEYIFANADPKNEQVRMLKQQIYEPEKVAAQMDAEQRIAPAKPGVPGGLNIVRKKPAVKLGADNAQLVPGMKITKDQGSKQAPKKTLQIGPSEEGGIRVDSE